VGKGDRKISGWKEIIVDLAGENREFQLICIIYTAMIRFKHECEQWIAGNACLCKWKTIFFPQHTSSPMDKGLLTIWADEEILFSSYTPLFELP
jgi:hypothetical protein